MVYQNHKSHSFRVRQGAPQGFVLDLVVISLFINDFPAFLPSFVRCFLYADDLTIWSSSPLAPTVVEATQQALIRLERWSEYWCLPLNPSKCEAFFSSVYSVPSPQYPTKKSFSLLYKAFLLPSLVYPTPG